MSEHKKNWDPTGANGASPTEAAGNKRRSSRIVHDERGNARVEWIEEAPDRPVSERVTLSIEDQGVDSRGVPASLHEKVEHGWDPYQGTGPAKPTSTRGSGANTRTDLRKLSEWIKLKRAIDNRGGGEGNQG